MNFHTFCFSHISVHCFNMAGSDSSVRGRNHDEDGAVPVVGAKLRQLQESVMHAMETLLNERLPAVDGRVPQQNANPHGEFDDENSVGAAEDYYRLLLWPSSRSWWSIWSWWKAWRRCSWAWFSPSCAL